MRMRAGLRSNHLEIENLKFIGFDDIFWAYLGCNNRSHRQRLAPTRAVDSPVEASERDNTATRPQCTRTPWRTGVMGLPVPLAKNSTHQLDLTMDLIWIVAST